MKEFELCEQDSILQLKLNGQNLNPIYVDFISLWEHHQHSFAQKGFLKEPLAKALGLKNNHRPWVLDATCGLGRDSLLMVFWGLKVWGWERHEILSSLLQDGWKRFQVHPDFSKIKQRFFLQQQDSVIGLKNWVGERPQVIYLDPMYPSGKRKARSQKEMEILRQVVGEDLDIEELFKLSLQVATERVVVKRPLWAKSLAKPTAIYEGKSTRYDMYRMGVV